MRVSLRRRWGRYKLSIVFGSVKKIWGINSTLADNQHILMWDFDEGDLKLVTRWLTAAQKDFRLPEIRVAQSSDGGGYHAYCFLRVPWMAALHIVSGTFGVDSKWVSLCSMRGHWTLRITDKGQGAPKHLFTIKSPVYATADDSELRSAVHYEIWDTKKTEVPA